MGRPNTTGLDHTESGYSTKWDRLNPEKRKIYYAKYYPKAQKKYQRRRYWLDKYMTAHGCGRCGYNYVEPSKKSFSVGTKVPGAKLTRLFAEIRKCVILCANCHRVKTYEENRRVAQ